MTVEMDEAIALSKLQAGVKRLITDYAGRKVAFTLIVVPVEGSGRTTGPLLSNIGKKGIIVMLDTALKHLKQE